jgi:hypothetical protein
MGARFAARGSQEKSPTRKIEGHPHPLLQDELQKRYPHTVCRHKEGKNPGEWADRPDSGKSDYRRSYF